MRKLISISFDNKNYFITTNNIISIMNTLYCHRVFLQAQLCVYNSNNNCLRLVSLGKITFLDSLIAINSLSLATFLLFIALPYTGKAAKLKLFIATRESIHFAFLRMKINLSGIYEDAHTLKDWQHHIVLINTLTIILYYLINIDNLHTSHMVAL